MIGLEADGITAQGMGAVKGFLLDEGWVRCVNAQLLPAHGDNRLLFLLLCGH